MSSLENSSLEFRLILMVVFLVTALACLLLILYKIIWRQGWKQTAGTAAVFTMALLTAAYLQVQPALYCREPDGPGVFAIPSFIFVIAGVCENTYVILRIRDAVRWGRHHLQRNAIQESLDNLPSGAGFFDEQGMPILINRQMHSVCRDLTGRDIQSAAELREALEHPAKDRVSYDPGFRVYCFSDGSAWKFSEASITAENGERYLQILVSEVSELYQNKLLLEKENRKLQEMAAAMKELSRNIVTLTREKETLAMKMRVHDDLGYSVLAARRMLEQDSEEKSEAFLAQWNRILRLLRNDNEPEEAAHQMVEERSGALGVKIFYTGEKLDDPGMEKLLDVILLEALSNSVRHAGATELYVEITGKAHSWVIVITNNGRKPEKEIEEGGGLSAIRKKVENCNGTVCIRSFPDYSLTIMIPKEEAHV